MMKSMRVMLTLACLASVGSSGSLLAGIKPSYQVRNSDGILGEYSPGKRDNTIQMDCTGCFPEGRIISMKIKDITETCRNYAETSHNKNKSVANIQCQPCDDYDLQVQAKVMIEGVPECVNRTFKYRKDACPADMVKAKPLTSQEESFENESSSFNTTVVVATGNMGMSLQAASLSREGAGKEESAKSSGIKFHLSNALLTVLLTNFHITPMASAFN